MPNLSPNQFRMVTNMKAAPNSQGTLFQGGPRPNQPWPRGYSPSRIAKARAVVDDPQKELIGGNRGQAWDAHTNRTRREVNQGVETLARSTVPDDALGSVRVQWGLGSTSGNDDLGQYHQYGFYGTKKKPWGLPAISVKKGEESTATVIHEMGHHISALLGTKHSAYTTAKKRGQEEAFAENYAEEHYRRHPAEGKQNLRFASGHTAWDWAHRESTWERQEEFTRAYKEEREKSPAAARQRDYYTVKGHAIADQILRKNPPGQLELF